MIRNLIITSKDDITHPRLTLTPTRIMLKIPSDMPTRQAVLCLALAQKHFARVVEQSYHGQITFNERTVSCRLENSNKSDSFNIKLEYGEDGLQSDSN